MIDAVEACFWFLVGWAVGLACMDFWKATMSRREWTENYLECVALRSELDRLREEVEVLRTSTYLGAPGRAWN